MSGPQFDQREFASQERGTTDGRALHYKKRGAAAGNRYPDGRTDSGDGRTFLLVTPPPCEKPAFIFDDATSTEGCSAAATVVESVRSLVSPSGAALHDLFSTRRRREGEGAYKREKEREEGAGIEYRNFNIKQRAVECRSNLPGKRSSRRGWVQRVRAPAPPICVHSVHSPNLHMFLPPQLSS